MPAREIDKYLAPAEPFEIQTNTGDGTFVPTLVPGMDTRMSYDLAVAATARRYIASAIMQAADDVGMPEIGDEFPYNLIREEVNEAREENEYGGPQIVDMFSDDVAAEMRKFAWMLDPQSVGRPGGWE